MSNKVVDIMLITLVILIFIVYFSVRNTVFNNTNIYGMLDEIEQYVEQENWDSALKTYKNLKKEWENKKYLVTINYGEADYSNFEITLNDILGGIKTKDAKTVIPNTEAAKNFWVNFHRVVPEP